MRFALAASIILVSFCSRVCNAGENEILLGLKDVQPDCRSVAVFASELYGGKEYYRAITEFERLGSYCPESPLKKKPLLFIAESYCNSEKWDEAIKTYQEFIAGSPGDELLPDAQYRLLYCFLQKGDYAGARELYDKLINSPSGSKWHDEMEYLNALSYISKEKWEDASVLISGYLKGNPNNRYEVKYNNLLKEISGYKKIPRRNPKTAGFYSAIIPGTGQLYAKKPGDGIMGFLLTGISLATALNCHANNAEFGTLVFGVLTLSFYSANIYHAMNDTVRYNEENNRKFYLKVADIAREGRPFWSLGIEFSRERNGILLHYTY
jgi:tetratricopeptide (TPR) repeat protein